MEPAIVEAVIDAAQRHWVFDNDIEITLEANPSSVEAARFEIYRRAGVNRVSLGIQALNDKDLRMLGRTHTAREAIAALEIAQSSFERVSFDLIYARQEQTLSDWKRELGLALSFAPDHLSLYQLTVEPETVFGARARVGKLNGLPDESLAADQYDLTQECCKNNGLEQYEVSNHAKRDALSRHNLIYWQGGDYLGIGPGAHGRLSLAKGRYATETPLNPAAWLQQVHSGTGENQRLRLSGESQATEYLLMGLRTRFGISLRRLKNMGGTALEPERLLHLEDLGMIEVSGDTLRVRQKGMPVLNAILREIMP